MTRTETRDAADAARVAAAAVEGEARREKLREAARLYEAAGLTGMADWCRRHAARA